MHAQHIITLLALASTVSSFPLSVTQPWVSNDINTIAPDCEPSPITGTLVLATPTPTATLPVSNLPISGLPVLGLPVSNLPVSDLPVSDLPVSNLPVSNLPVSNLPVSNLPVSDLPVSNLPVSNRPVSNLPVPSLPVTSLPAYVLPTAAPTPISSSGSDGNSNQNVGNSGQNSGGSASNQGTINKDYTVEQATTTCGNSQLNCCNQITKKGDTTDAGLIGGVFGDGSLGIECSSLDLTAIGVQVPISKACDAKAACCQEYTTQNGLVNIGCIALASLI